MPRIHFVLVCLGLTVPLIPVIATISHSFLVGYAESEGLPSGLGFGLATFPPILCYTLNKNVVFYSFILPVTLLMLVGITALLVTIWVVHKVRTAIGIQWNPLMAGSGGGGGPGGHRTPPPNSTAIYKCRSIRISFRPGGLRTYENGNSRGVREGGVRGS